MQSGGSYSIAPVPKLLLLGDSLTQQGFSENGGWISVIADRLQRRCDVISMGFSGYTTRLICHYFTTIADSLKGADCCGFVLLLGTNDSVVGGPQHVPLLEYERNLSAVVKSLKERFPNVPLNQFIIVSPPPIDEEMCQKRGRIMYNAPLNRFNHVVESYANACKSVSEELSTSFVDFFHIASEAGAARCLNEEPLKGKMANFFCDGVHFGPVGAQLLADAIWPEVDKFTKEVKALLPNWRDIDISDISFDY